MSSSSMLSSIADSKAVRIPSVSWEQLTQEEKKHTVEVNCEVSVMTLSTAELPSTNLHITGSLE